MDGPESGSRAVLPKRIIIGTFLHNYRWGYQIRGDERGYIEKVKRYQNLGIEFFTLEKEPSLQDGMGERVYRSLKLRGCAIPPRGIWELVVLSFRALGCTIRGYPSHPIAIYAYNQDIENLWTAYLMKIFIGARLVVIYHQVRRPAFLSFREGIRDRTRRGFHPVRAVLNSVLPGVNRFAANHADVHIALSEATKRDVEKYVGIRDCAVIGNGLDTVKFHPMNLPKTFDAVFLGRLAPQKGIDVLLKAWSECVRENPNRRLLLLGGGEPQDISFYRRMAKEFCLENNVTFAGFVEDGEMVRLLNSSRLFVFPSRNEGFAQAVSQAMGCGLCCILSDIAPLKEVYGNSAAFVPVDQPAALAKKITELLRVGDEKDLFAVKARQLAQTFSWDNTVIGELKQLSRDAELKNRAIAPRSEPN